MDPPAKRRNIATTAGGASYNKRQRPDNMHAQPPPRRPERPVPPHAQNADWSKWTDYDAGTGSAAASANVNALASIYDDVDACEDKDNEDEAPGSPVEKPETHFSTFTPMGAGKKKPLFSQGEGQWKSKPRTHPVYGQSSAFPGLDDVAYITGTRPRDGALPDDPLVYLSMVRVEAGGLPTTFRREIEDTDATIYNAGDTRGYYEDGAYVAAPQIGPAIPSGFKPAAVQTNICEVHDTSFDAQDMYNQRLLARFESLRALLRTDPPEDVKKALHQTHCFTFPTRPKQMANAVRRWRKTFVEQYPRPAQVAQMDDWCVLQLLDIIKRMLVPGKAIHKYVGIWVSALLAKLAELIPEWSNDAFVVRELAFRALRVRASFTGEQIREVMDKEKGWDEDDANFFGDEDQKKNTKKKDKAQQQPASSNAASNSPDPVTSAESSNNDDLFAQLRERKEFLLKKAELLKHVEQLPALPTKMEHYLTKAGAEALLQDLGYSPDGSSCLDDPDASEEEDNDIVTYRLPDVHTRTAIDMIVTVAGEVYRQKDIMRYKEIWGEYDYLAPPTTYQPTEPSDLIYSRRSSSSKVPPLLSPISSPEYEPQL